MAVAPRTWTEHPLLDAVSDVALQPIASPYILGKLVFNCAASYLLSHYPAGRCSTDLSNSGPKPIPICCASSFVS